MLVDQMRGGGRTVTLARHGTVAGRPAAAMVRAVVVDEAELMHFAVRALLSTVPGYTMVASASSVSDGGPLAPGAHGHLLKDPAPEALAAYLHEVAAGLRVLDQRLGRSRPGDHRTDAT